MKHQKYYVSDDSREGYEDAPHRSKKKTKEWCKGKVGVRHEGKWEPYQPSATYLEGWKVFVCQNCRKYLKLDYPKRDWGVK